MSTGIMIVSIADWIIYLTIELFFFLNNFTLSLYQQVHVVVAENRHHYCTRHLPVTDRPMTSLDICHMWRDRSQTLLPLALCSLLEPKA